MSLVLRFLTDRTGAATAKYGLVAAVISAAIVTAALGIVSKLSMTAGPGRLGP
ncbi:MAG: Flp family type IVb pilin [Xanthobacteraceae bacterium]|jgi:Flp pilus assembly pilin Flp